MASLLQKTVNCKQECLEECNGAHSRQDSGKSCRERRLDAWEAGRRSGVLRESGSADGRRKTSKLWEAVRSSLRIVRHRIEGHCEDRGSERLERESGEEQVDDVYELGRENTRSRKASRSFSGSWGSDRSNVWCGTGRDRVVLREDVNLTWILKGANAEGLSEIERKSRQSLHTEEKNFMEKKGGCEKRAESGRFGAWVNSKGSKNSRSSVTKDPCEKRDENLEVWQCSEEEEEEETQSNKCFRGVGLLKLREKGRRAIEGSQKLEIECTNDELKMDNAMQDEQPVLPDDILEMCLAWAPFASLTRARVVCKRWKSLTLSPNFLLLRENIPSQRPWLFLFGLSRDGLSVGQIQAYDPTFTKWHTIEANYLTGRRLYSVTAIDSLIYVVGGCSSSCPTRTGRPDKSRLKTHRTVLVYSPLTGLWRKASSMRNARSMAIVGMFEVKQKPNAGGDCTTRVFGNSFPTIQGSGSESHMDQGSPVRARVRERNPRRGRELAVYGGAERRGVEMSDRARESSVFWEANHDFAGKCNHDDHNSEGPESKLYNTQTRGCEKVSKQRSKYGLIVVGGQGTWNEQLDSAEIYDPITDRWREIASLPADHGVTCAGIFCKGFFYVYSESNQLAAYDVDQEVWHSIRVSHAPSRLIDYSPKLVSCCDRVFLLSVAWGVRDEAGREKARRKIWELYRGQTSLEWLEVSQHPDAPLDWNAVFVSDGEKIFGVEMFKIFGQVLDFVTTCNVTGSKSMSWERVARMQMAMNEMDSVSCLTKTAVVLQL